MGQLLVGAVIALVGFSANLNATELDREGERANVMTRAKDLPGTLVVRISDKTGVAEVAHVAQELKEEKLNVDLSFSAVKVGESYAASSLKVFGQKELDQERGQESWYFYWGYRGGYYYPSYWYAGYGYGYTPYYNYWWGGYSYYYYRPYYYYPYYRPCCW